VSCVATLRNSALCEMFYLSVCFIWRSGRMKVIYRNDSNWRLEWKQTLSSSRCDLQFYA